MKHKCVKLLINNQYVEIDKKISNFIKLLNDWDFFTNNSCEDNLGDIWICFDFMSDVQRMMQLILKDHTENVINGNFNTLFEYLTSNDIKWTIGFTENCVLDPYKEDHIKGTGALESYVSLRFPKKDFKMIEQYFNNIFK